MFASHCPAPGGGGPRSRISRSTRTAHPSATRGDLPTPIAAPPTFRKRSPRRRAARMLRTHAHTRTDGRRRRARSLRGRGRERETGMREGGPRETDFDYLGIVAAFTAAHAILTRLSRLPRTRSTTLLLVMYIGHRWRNRRRRLSSSRSFPDPRRDAI